MKELYKILINAGLAGSLVTLGAMSTGNITLETCYYAAIAGALIALNQIKEYFKIPGGIKILSLF